MSTLTNTPRTPVVLRLERRKSFSLALWFRDHSGRSVDITGCQVLLAVGRGGSDNEFATHEGTVLSPDVGYARLDIQAFDLDIDAKEYPFSITLLDPEGYSSTVVKGIIDVQDNPEVESVFHEYESTNPPSSLEIQLRGKTAINVTVGHVFPPDGTTYTVQERSQLSQLDPAAQLPPGGFPGNVLAKRTGHDYETRWVAQSGGGGGIDPSGVPEGYVPMATGEESWNWAELPPSGVITVNGQSDNVELSLADIPDSQERVAVTPIQRQAINNLGTAATKDDEYFRLKEDTIPVGEVTGMVPAAQTQRVSALNGIQSGTAHPNTGWNGTPVVGDIYFQLES